MNARHTAPVGSLALAVTLVLGLTLLSPGARAATVTSDEATPYTFAMIGDVPYGEDDLAHFPTFVAGINADPDVTMVTHLGDIKSGSQRCDDAYFATVAEDFARFEVPLVYTPGDNEWTDCHRVTNGGYDPLERLAAVRSRFFARPGTTLGRPAHVWSQARLGVPENVRYRRAGVEFATLHVVGSNNDLAPWDGLGHTTATRAQLAEQRNRMRTTITHVRAAFRDARRHHLRGVVLSQQADMFDLTVTDPDPADYSAFRPLVRTLVQQARRFDGQVYLFNGDSHVFTSDRPLARGSAWLDFYGIHGSADTLRRVTVDGSDLGEADWLKVTVRPRGGRLLDVQRVPGA